MIIFVENYRLRYFIELSYLGKNYHGWQLQPNAVSVQEIIEKALSLLLKNTIKIVGAGRTDTGVHARQMYAHFDVEKSQDTHQLKNKLNSFLPFDIAIHQIIPVVDQAHARFDAVQRSYQYFIHQEKNPFIEDTSYLITKKLDIEVMNKAAKLLLSFKDFKSFSKTHTDVKTYICKIENAKWEVIDNQLVFSISADRFLRNMVRAIVGTILDVGLHKISVDEFVSIIEARNRQKAGFSVPGKALFLTKIKYPPQIYK